MPIKENWENRNGKSVQEFKSGKYERTSIEVKSDVRDLERECMRLCGKTYPRNSHERRRYANRRFQKKLSL